MLGGRQGRQVDVQPQPVSSQVVAQRAALAAEEALAALAQLRDLHIAELIERASQARLLGKAYPIPRARQSALRAQTRVDLAKRATAGQNAEQHIKQLVAGAVLHHFQWQLHGRKERLQKVGAGQAVAKHAQRGKIRVFRHGRQVDNWTHRRPPYIGIAMRL
jgi:hypothetical protein